MPENPPPPSLPVEARIAALRRQRETLLGLAPEKALEQILEAPQPAALVHSLAVQDLYWLIHDIGHRDALPLLALASDRQCEHLLDLDIWRKDRLEMSALAQWLDLLSAAQRPGLAAWLMTAQSDLLELFLSRAIEVVLREHDQDPGDFGGGFFSLDNVTYVRMRPGTAATDESPAAADRREGVLRRLLEQMADLDFRRYRDLLDTSRAVLAAEAEEEAYRWRNVRLAEMGLPPFEEAVGLYQPLAAADLPSGGSAAAWPTAAEAATALLPSRLLVHQGRFSEALAELDTHGRRRVQGELAALCNRMIVADLKTVHSRRELQPVVDKAAGYLSIGLDRIVKDDPHRRTTGHWLAGQPLVSIFRVGYGAAVELKRRTEHWKKECWCLREGLTLAFWGEQWLGVLGGLLIRRPLYYDNYRSGDSLYRDFGSSRELDETAGLMDQIMAMDRLLSSVSWQRPAGAMPGDLTWKSFLLTLWARGHGGLPPEPAPFSVKCFGGFFQRLWQPGPGGRVVRKEMKAAFLRWLRQASGLPEDRLLALGAAAFETLFSELEQELGRVAVDDLDPRYIRSFLLVAE